MAVKKSSTVKSSAYTAAGPVPVNRLNKLAVKKSAKFRAASGYTGMAPGGMFRKGKRMKTK